MTLMKRIYNRRNFIENTTKGIAAAGFIPAVTGPGPEKTDLKTLFIHHVFFWLRQPVTEEIRRKFENSLKKLVSVETIVDFHLGIPAPTDRDVIDNSYTYSLLTTFRNKADQDIYQTHPTHLKFIEESQDLWEKVVVYDTVNF